MKKCPYCAEEIQDEAIKCKHCGEWVEKDVQASSPPVDEAKKIDPSEMHPQREAIPLDSDEEINSKKIAGLKQCPTCGKWDVHRAYVEDGGMGNWCPHCKKSVNDENIIESQERQLNDANKHINNAAIAGVISGGLTLLLSALGTIPMWSGVIESLLSFLLSFGIYKKSRVCAIILFGLFLINKIGQIADKELKSFGLIIGIIFLYYFFQGIRGCFAWQKLAKTQ